VEGKWWVRKASDLRPLVLKFVDFLDYGKGRMQTEKVIALIFAIRDALQSREQFEGVQQTISGLSALSLDRKKMLSLPPRTPPQFQSDLKAVVDHIPASLKTVADAFSEAAPYLNWNADTNSSDGYYEAGSDLGKSYLEGNISCRLVGPANSFVFSENLYLYLFFLRPCTLYRDHIHQASEVYFNLSGPCGFRLGDEDWVDYPGDSIIWNPPSRPHATRVYQTPFLSAVSWVSDLDSICRVIPRDDWQMLEAKLEPN
tara:strand:+ start:100 stop:870 length:771 start_codon:yes stop_codon:yes gene_type:complete